MYQQKNLLGITLPSFGITFFHNNVRIACTLVRLAACLDLL